jgi:hypothetical protein
MMEAWAVSVFGKRFTGLFESWDLKESENGSFMQKPRVEHFIIGHLM